MSNHIHLLDVVALTEDIPDRGLRRGQVGTVVEMLGPGVFEVEFVDWYNAGLGEYGMELSAEQIERVRSLAGRYPIRMVLLFGSVLSPGKEHARSDLDVAVAFEGSVPDRRVLADLGHGLQEIFPEREVDVAVLNYADPLLLKKIAENCLLVYGDSQRFAEFKIYAYKRFQDHRRFFEMERAFVKRYLESRRRAG